jgi:hypothetical protein
MEKRAEPHWEPHFGQGARGGRRPAAGSSRRMLLGVAAALVLFGGGAAVWLFLRPGAAPTASLPPMTSPPLTTAPAPTTTTLAALPEATTPSSVPTTFPAGTLSAVPPTTQAPAPTTTPAPPPQSGSAGLADAREAFRRGEYRDAARSFAANLRTARGSHTVQILVACSDETLQKAQASVPAPELYIVPVDYQGRSCYRLLWGLFDSESRAQAAVAQVPAYFRENGAKPKAVSSAAILP